MVHGMGERLMGSAIIALNCSIERVSQLSGAFDVFASRKPSDLGANLLAELPRTSFPSKRWAVVFLHQYGSKVVKRGCSLVAGFKRSQNLPLPVIQASKVGEISDYRFYWRPLERINREHLNDQVCEIIPKISEWSGLFDHRPNPVMDAFSGWNRFSM